MHYTDRHKIMLLVGPVVVRPLLAEWGAEKTAIAAELERAEAAKSRCLLAKCYDSENHTRDRGPAMIQRTRARTSHTFRQMAFGIATAVALTTATATTAQPRLTGDDIERIAHSVVRIDALRNGELIATGSGTVIGPTGLIVTNRHVVENSDDWGIAVLRDIDERPVPEYRARLLGYSQEVDIAFLAIDRWADGEPLIDENLDLPHAVSAESALRRGDYVALLGYPGIGSGFLTFTEGGITTILRGSVGGETASIAYQTDAEIGPGNSGGLAVNNNGEMVGIPTAVATETTGGRLGVIITLDAVVEAINAGLETDLRNTNASFVDAFAEANYGTLLVEAGRRPEGHTAAGIAGGAIDVSDVIDGCRGWVSRTPDYRIRWTGRAGSLGFRFAAAETGANTDDTTLAVRTPDGRWFCDDDSGNGIDPMVLLDDPKPGDYTVWAGSYVRNAYIEGELRVLDSASLPTEDPDIRFPIRVFVEPGPHSGEALAEAYDRRECTTGHLQAVADPRLAQVGVYIGVQPVPTIPPSGDPATDAGRAIGGLIALGARARNQVTVYTMIDGQPAVVLYSGRTRRFGNAVKDACNVILNAAGVER